MYARVYAPFFQAPQCGEFAALARAGIEVTGPSSVFSDCKNVVGLAPRELQVSYERPYAGLMLFFLTSGPLLFSAVSKVKAHLDPHEEGIEPDERRRRLGNHAADLAANAGAHLHPAATEEEQEAL
eukprot:539272-Pyramimonas_sp.AAC.1